MFPFILVRYQVLTRLSPASWPAHLVTSYLSHANIWVLASYTFLEAVSSLPTTCNYHGLLLWLHALFIVVCGLSQQKDITAWTLYRAPTVSIRLPKPIEEADTQREANGPSHKIERVRGRFNRCQSSPLTGRGRHVGHT